MDRVAEIFGSAVELPVHSGAPGYDFAGIL
jgi:hypothetical protein